MGCCGIFSYLMTHTVICASAPRLGPILFNSNNSNIDSRWSFSCLKVNKYKNKIKIIKSSNRNNNVVEVVQEQQQLSEELVSSVCSAKESNEALEMIAEFTQKTSGVVSATDCCSIITSALRRDNSHLALSIFYAMPQSPPFEIDTWTWSPPDAHVYTALVQGLAASLRVSDALNILPHICTLGVSQVPFGKVVKCPTCLIAVAVAQPQQGVQIASCAKCRYKYELVSGDIISIESEEISMDIPAWQRALRFLQIRKKSIPAAVHSIVVQIPSGMARTHKFATETVELPAQEGERVTIACAAPLNVYREVGPFKFSPKASNLYPEEPMCLTNHKDGRVSPLLRAPSKDGNTTFLSPSILIPLLAVLATGDAVSGMIDSSLPQLLPVAAVASLTAGVTWNTLFLPQLSQLPQKSADVIAIKQLLLSQYDVLQSRIKELKEGAEKEIWMLARMCQLENKIFAIGEPSYRARRNRVQRVRGSLQKSLEGRIDLIVTYAKISSMIEIEVEMDSEVLAAEAVSNAESFAERIQQIMELENLEEKWRMQVEANDEAERLLNSQTTSVEEF